jgi:hypothetical protein
MIKEIICVQSASEFSGKRRPGDEEGWGGRCNWLRILSIEGFTPSGSVVISQLINLKKIFLFVQSVSYGVKATQAYWDGSRY